MSRHFLTPLASFAWPFPEGATSHRYFTNVERAEGSVTTAAGSWGHSIIEIDDDYVDVIRLRAAILAREPRRLQSRPDLAAAEWDALLFAIETLSRDYPEVVALARDGASLRLRNRPLGIDRWVRFGDATSLPDSPLAFLASLIEEDAFLLTEHAGHLRLDAIASTFASSWSPTFDLGMSFSDLHGPVPRIHGIGMVDRTERFLLAMRPGEAFRRLNWSVDAYGDLDASVEQMHRRGPSPLDAMIAEGDFSDLHLRVEIQHTIKLPMTGALLFTIKIQLARFGDIVTIPAWGHQLHAIIATLPEDIAAYKGIAAYRPALLDWFSRVMASATVSHRQARTATP